MKENESGRSMVEMLGVLAIIGLLSVVVVMGLKDAMNRARAYNLIDEARKRAVVVMTQIQLQGSQNPTLSEFSNNETMAGTFANEVITDAGRQQFGLKVSGVTAAVCEKILETIDENSALRRLASLTNIHQPVITCDSDTTYLMVYNNDMTPEDKVRSCQTESDCETACATCENNVCTNECEITPTTCTTNSECANAGVCAGCVKADGAESGTCQYACEELEYLESTGTQWIDTGFKADYNSSIETQAHWTRFSSMSELFGARDSATAHYDLLQEQSKLYYQYGSAYPDVSFSICNEKTCHYQTNKNKFYINNELVLTASTDFFSLNSSLALFCINYSQNFNRFAKSQIYYFKIWDNGELVRDFIPVLDPNGTPAMLDRVEPKLYYNQGTGQFLYGRKQ